MINTLGSKTEQNKNRSSLPVYISTDLSPQMCVLDDKAAISEMLYLREKISLLLINRFLVLIAFSKYYCWLEQLTPPLHH